MTLNDRLTALGGDASQQRCPAQRLIDNLPGEESKALLAALADQRISTLKIHSALRAEGHSLGRPTLQEHRAGTCYCSTDLT